MSDHDHHDHRQDTGDLHRELHAHLPPDRALRAEAMERPLSEKGRINADTGAARAEGD